MCPDFGEVRSCLNFVKLYEDKSEDDDEAVDPINIIINYANQIDEIPKVYHQY